MVIAEELGRALAIEPFIDTVVVAGGLLQRSGHPAAATLLERIAEGSAIVAVASTEPDAADHSVSTKAVHDGSEWVLTGEKIVVTSAPLATHLLITARTSGEPKDRQGFRCSSPSSTRPHHRQAWRLTATAPSMIGVPPT